MRRGTTPTITFNLPFDTAGVIKDLRITFAQDSGSVIEKKLADCELDGTSIYLDLTQEDTLKLTHNKAVKIQVKILTIDGQVMASIPRSISCGEILNTEVL